MKNVVFSIALAWLVVFHISAQTPKAVQKGNSLLWEISGKGLKEPSYIFGTYHAAGKSFLDSLPGVKKQFDKSKTVVGEVLTDETMVQKMMPFMLLQGTSLDKILTQAEFGEVDAVVKEKMGVGLVQLNQLKPIAVQMTIVMMLVPKDISPSNPALDMYFQSEAKAVNKKVTAFETVEEQARLLFDIPMERQKELLLLTVREKERMIRESAVLFRHYQQQDLNAVEQDFKDNKDMNPQEMDALLIKRNKAWMTKIPSILQSGTTFIAVGAGHLPGEQGLLHLLTQSGYTVKPISSK